MKKSGKQSLGKASALDSQPGTSKEALKRTRQTPLPKETSKVGLVSPSKMTSFSKELFNTWRDIRWFQIPLSSLRKPKAGLFSFTFQSSLQRYQQLRKNKRLKVGRPFSVLPFPSLSLPFTDPPSFQDALRGDNHRTSRTDRSKVHKRLSAHRNDSQSFLRRMQKKFQKHQPSPDPLPPKRAPSPAVSGQQWVTGLGRRSRKKPKKGDSAPPAKTPGRGKSSHERSNSKTPLEEEEEEEVEDIFPPDWSPPSFLFKEEPPPLSPDPEPGISQEMLDGTETSESADKSEQEDSVPPAETPGRDNGCGVWGDPESPLKEEEEGTSLLPDLPLRRVALLYNEESPPLSPTPGPSEPRSSQEMPDQEAGGSPRMGGPSSSPHLHLLLPGSGNSSRSSISSSSDEFLEGPGGLTPDSDEEEDMDDSSLIPLRDLLHMDESSSSPLEMSSCSSPRRDSYLTSLDKLLEEKREQIREEEELERSLGSELLFSKWSNAGEASEETEASLLDTQRLVLEQFSISAGTIPIVHPGENIFRPPSYPRSAFVLDTAGLKPQNHLESLLFSSSSSTTQQLAILHSGSLGFIYHGIAKCPLPVLRWLFQLMSLNPDASRDAFQNLWNISTYQNISSDAGLWCPELKDITQAFYNFGACSSTLFPAGLVQHEFISEILEFPEYSSKPADVENENIYFQLSFIPMLEDTFKFLTLCVTTQPRCYPDHHRLAILALLCRVSLDRNLRKQPLIDLQQLLLVLLEGLQKWKETLPELCRSLGHVSQHHHNMVAVVRCFPDTTTRGRQLRRNLSLYFIMKLLGKMKMMAPNFWQEEIQLQQLCELLPLMRPSCLKQALQKRQKLQMEPAKNQQKTLSALDHEACYLCYNLLVLANVVVGIKPASPREQDPMWVSRLEFPEDGLPHPSESSEDKPVVQTTDPHWILQYDPGTQIFAFIRASFRFASQGHLQQLCLQVQQHISSSLREDPALLYRTKLKNLAAQTYVKWQELLSQGWLQLTR